jgi:cell division protein ZapA
MSELSIKVTIAGRIYPINVKAEEEERVRNAAMEVDKNVKFLLDNYAVKDKQDLLAMTALQMSTKILEIGDQPKAAVDETQLAELERLVNSMV